MSFMLLGILNAQAAGGGGAAYDLLETTTLTSSASSVTFTGLGSYSGYKHLQIRAVSRGTRASTVYGLSMRINSDTGTNYSQHWLRGRSSAVASIGAGSDNRIYLSFPPASSETSDAFAPTIVDVLDFSSSAKNTTIRALAGNAASSGTPQIDLISGGWYDTAAVTNIELYDVYGDNILTGSRFSLYGVK